jgi:carboxyl-terminal processing protease
MRSISPEGAPNIRMISENCKLAAHWRPIRFLKRSARWATVLVILTVALGPGSAVSGKAAGGQAQKQAAPSGSYQAAVERPRQAPKSRAGLLKPDAPAAASTGIADDPVAPLEAKVARVYATLEDNYLGPLDPDKTLLDGAIRQALGTLDPFSAFFDRDQFRQLQEQQRGQTMGFGSILYVQPGKVLVISAAEGSPSARAGVGPGDEIVAVNGTRVAGLDFQSLIALLEKARSGPVRLGVIHPGRVVPDDVNLKPAEVEQPSVDKSFMLGTDVGYMHVTGFESKTPQEVSQAIDKLESAAIPANPERAHKTRTLASSAALHGLILDLRDNHGGLVDSAIGVASLFLPPGLSVLTVRGRAQPEQTARTATVPAPYHAYEGPLIILVNGETASAAEVVAAALEEHDRALIAGGPTYGKGVVQSVMPLSDSMGLALTTAQYFTPSGRSIQRPIPGTVLENMASDNTRASDFRTDDGRSLAAGGGVTPDVALPPRQIDPWVGFLEQRGAFTDFASNYRSDHGEVPRSFQPDDQTLSDFRDFLHRSGVLTPDEYWNRDQDYLKLRIRIELMNITYGLQVGDEVATEADPQVEGAAQLMSRVDELLKKPVTRAER